MPTRSRLRRAQRANTNPLQALGPLLVLGVRLAPSRLCEHLGTYLLRLEADHCCRTGSTACCPCCAGYFQDQTHQTTCQVCSQRESFRISSRQLDLTSSLLDTNPHAPYSAPGSTSSSQCSVTPVAGYTNSASCSISSNGAGKEVCRTSTRFSPAVVFLSYSFSAASSGGAPPNTTPINRKRDIKCARGYKRCPIYSGLGGFDCVNPRTDTENCGGCVFIDGVQPTDAEAGPAGVDCTAIPDVSMVQCVKSQCIIRESPP